MTEITYPAVGKANIGSVARARKPFVQSPVTAAGGATRLHPACPAGGGPNSAGPPPAPSSPPGDRRRSQLRRGRTTPRCEDVPTPLAVTGTVPPMSIVLTESYRDGLARVQVEAARLRLDAQS